eukprot:TRINITY_DN489_c0_g1_i1.p1 TRINITY_DN489_c0_g1~~TRINITY_DN489_c0_g1_i1.p1  ORF type:complete len:599 (+),score=159.92 TRINITY_DN489_c0_g1_i1:39-1799(+)
MSCVQAALSCGSLQSQFSAVCIARDFLHDRVSALGGAHQTRVDPLCCGFVGGSSPGLGSTRSCAFTGSGFASLQVSLANIESTSRGRRGGGALAATAAVFDQLSQNFELVWTKIRGLDMLTEENIKEPMREIRQALLEADVSLPVVKRFVKDVSQKAVGAGIVKGIRPDQQLAKVVNDELVQLMGGDMSPVDYAKSGPTVILMAGLQGVGKTTACGKLARLFQKKEKKVMMVATDVYRPAAIDQLVKLGAQVGVPVFEMGTSEQPAVIAKKALEEAKAQEIDVVIVDTAGRLQINQEMMNELKAIRQAVNPTETLLVVDAMTGQQAAALVAAFNLEVGITGAILTKLDGDSRGGAALSVREVSGKPIKFVGEGETMDSLEPFYPNRMASRILGMGDVVTLVEKAQEAVAEEEAEDMKRKIMESTFDFDDLVKQTKWIARMGNLGTLTKYIPGMNKVSPQQIYEAEQSLKIMEAIVGAMEPEERKDPELLAKSPSRRRRIAEASGKSQEQVGQLVTQLYNMRAQMKNIYSLMNGTIPGVDGLGDDPMRGARKAAPGTAKRKRKSGLKGDLVAASKDSASPRGFGARK